jgi:nucleoside-triphosphatase
MQKKIKKLLLTGLPGCGKTTVIIRLADMLKARKIAGFYTQEIRDAGQRTGFSLQTFSGGKSVLSNINLKNGPRVGRYRVDVEKFEQIVLLELAVNKDADLYLIDEIGKMECFSSKFIEMIKQILDSSIPLVATVALKGSGFIAQVKDLEDVELITVTAENRDLLPSKISTQMSDLGFLKKVLKNVQ